MDSLTGRVETITRDVSRVPSRVSTTVGLALLLSVFAFSVLQPVHADDPVFNTSKNISNNPGNANGPQIAVSGNNVYVAWRENSDIYFRASTNNGGTFGGTTNLSNNAGTSQAPRIAAFGDNVYVLWQDNTPGNNDIFFKKSANNGTSFGSLVNLSLDGFDSGGALSNLDLAAFSGGAYAVWQDDDDQAVTDIDMIFRKVYNNGTLGSK
ncbi:MAG TPA: hypothetical protein VI698_05490, partial [Nitrososphaerales archaeon]|nr:hypothetical protein [Nitrososphaerales archaeon]